MGHVIWSVTFLSLVHSLLRSLRWPSHDLILSSLTVPCASCVDLVAHLTVTIRQYRLGINMCTRHNTCLSEVVWNMPKLFTGVQCTVQWLTSWSVNSFKLLSISFFLRLVKSFLTRTHHAGYYLEVWEVRNERWSFVDTSRKLLSRERLIFLPCFSHSETWLEVTATLKAMSSFSATTLNILSWQIESYNWWGYQWWVGNFQCIVVE